MNRPSTLSLNSELRHLPVSQRHQLNGLLDLNENWKSLATIIRNPDRPNELLLKATAISLLDEQRKRPNGSPSNALFEYWSTYGRKRHTISDAIFFLEQCELNRAADLIRSGLLITNENESEVHHEKDQKDEEEVVDDNECNDDHNKLYEDEEEEEEEEEQAVEEQVKTKEQVDKEATQINDKPETEPSAKKAKMEESTSSKEINSTCNNGDTGEAAIDKKCNDTILSAYQDLNIQSHLYNNILLIGLLHLRTTIPHRWNVFLTLIILFSLLQRW